MAGGRSRSRDVQIHLKDRSFSGLDFRDAQRASKAPTLASSCPALLSMIIWKHPRHWASVWSRGRAERARQRAAVSRLRRAVHEHCKCSVGASSAPLSRGNPSNWCQEWSSSASARVEPTYTSASSGLTAFDGMYNCDADGSSSGGGCRWTRARAFAPVFSSP